MKIFPPFLLHEQVLIGSYPNTSDNPAYKVKMALTSRDPAALAAALEGLRQALPHTRDAP
jgi:hypothetical protein